MTAGILKINTIGIGKDTLMSKETDDKLRKQSKINENVKKVKQNKISASVMLSENRLSSPMKNKHD